MSNDSRLNEPTSEIPHTDDMDMESVAGLKDFALKLYERDEVSASCLLLQDEAGVDVTVLLFAAWMGAAHRLALSKHDVAAAHAQVADWSGEIVKPLRAIRRRLKTGPAPAPSDQTGKLRKSVQALEILAELIELDVLDAFGHGMKPPPERLAAVEAIIAGMTSVVRHAAGREPDTQDMDAILLIAAAAKSEAAKTERKAAE